MNFETISKVIDFLLKTCLTAFLSFATFTLAVDKSVLDRGKTCSELATKVFEVAAKDTTNIERTRIHVNLLIGYSDEACQRFSKSLIKEVMKLLDETPQEKVSTSSTDTPSINLTGWAVLGKIGGTYGQINFDNLEAVLVPTIGSTEGKIFKARWSVNVRQTNRPIQDPTNKVVGMLREGDCIKAKNPQLVRGNVWAEVEEVICPG